VEGVEVSVIAGLVHPIDGREGHMAESVWLAGWLEWVVMDWVMMMEEEEARQSAWSRVDTIERAPKMNRVPDRGVIFDGESIHPSILQKSRSTKLSMRKTPLLINFPVVIKLLRN
jgi:hypothetical protein